jgi:integrase
MGEDEVLAFLTHLAVDRKLAASTQTQALAALQFLYRHVIDRSLMGMGNVPKARAPLRLPVVLSEREVSAVIGKLGGVPRVVAMLLYGSGMRLLECLTLRVKDIDLECSARWPRRFVRVESANGRAVTVFVIRSRRTFGGGVRYPNSARTSRPPRYHDDDGLHALLNRGGLGVRSPADRVFGNTRLRD